MDLISSHILDGDDPDSHMDTQMTTSATAVDQLSPQIQNNDNNQDSTHHRGEPPPLEGGKPIEVQISEDRTYATLKPYQKPRAKRNRNRRPAIHLITETFPSLENPTIENFTKYFCITSDSGKNLSEINVIKANKEIERLLGAPPKSITETRAGHLIIEVRNRNQSNNITNLTRLDTTAVKVEAHKTLNTVKGTIYYRNHPNYSTQELLEELEKFNVTEIYQTKRRINGTLCDQPVYILSFNVCNLPSQINIGWTKCSVRQHIPRPRRCTKCQMFGHGINVCREEVGTCYNCGEDLHELPCNKQPKCPNCEESHPATSPLCFYYRLEQETIAMQCKERIPYPEAKRIVKSRFIQAKTTFADVTRQEEITAHKGPKTTTYARPATQTTEPVVLPTQRSQSSQPTRLTTGRVLLQPTAQLPPNPKPAPPKERSRYQTLQSTVPQTQSIIQPDSHGNLSRPAAEDRENSEKTAQKPPLVSVEAWKDSTEPSRRDKKRSWASDLRSASAERATKRPQNPPHQFVFKKFPMPANMPTTLPPQVTPTRPPVQETASEIYPKVTKPTNKTLSDPKQRNPQ